MIVGLSGRAGSGKSTVAKFLNEHCAFARTSFAKPIKEMLRAMGLTEEEIYGNARERASEYIQGKSPRYAMQTLGTEWGRNMIGEDLWVNVWALNIDNTYSSDENIIVEDVRFPNEVLAIHARDGFLIHIERPFSGEPSAPAHESENSATVHCLQSANH
jgi:hypothetical protein